MSKLSNPILMTALILLSTTLAWPQVASDLPSLTGSNIVLDGTITDSNGNPVPMARLTLSPINGQTGQTTFSDNDARFFFYRLQPARYSLTVSATGYERSTRTFDLTYGSQTITFVLHPEKSADSPTAATVHTDELKIPKEAIDKYSNGRDYLEQKDLKKAEREFKSAIQEYPEYGAAFSALGIVYIQTQNPSKARECFVRSLEINNAIGESHLGIGLLNNDGKQYAEAEANLRRAEELIPKDWRVYYELGRSFYYTDQLGSAEVAFKRAREMHEGYGNLHLLLANTLALQGKLPDALQEMKEFVKVAPKSKLAPQVREKIKLIEAEISKEQ